MKKKLTLRHKLYDIHHFAIANLWHTMYNSFGIHIVYMYADILHMCPPPCSNHRHRYLHIYYFVAAGMRNMLNNWIRLARCMSHRLNGRHGNDHYPNIRLCFPENFKKRFMFFIMYAL